MNRPSARKSSLSGLTPAEPNNDATVPVEIRTQPASTGKVTATIDADLLGRARSAFLIDGPLRGVRSFSNWISEAIEEKTTAVELDRNGGQQFPSTAPGTIPTGRRP